MRLVACDEIDIDLEKRREHKHGTRNYSKKKRMRLRNIFSIAIMNIMNTRILKGKNILV
jgi:hypothetical protein